MDCRWWWLLTFLLVVGCSSKGGPDAAGQGTAEVTRGGTPLIVVDQFGYLPDAVKVAVLRDPRRGFDAALSYRPAPELHVVMAGEREPVWRGAPSVWQGGAVDPSSGDAAWQLDFSELATPGLYEVLDPLAGLRSPAFQIGLDVYDEVLKQALRTFFYQRAGFAKQPPFAEPAWTDAASHLGPGQDGEARLYSAPDDPSTARDVRGGWYDAGDFNKYTNWSADYVVGLLHAYFERPEVWGDDFDLPESGNGVPDILDEIDWGLAWLERMQEPDGGVLSIVGLDHASPPSAATGPSRYGPASTSASLTTAAAFALASEVFGREAALESRAPALFARAERAWAWAQAHPDVEFRNNDEAFGSVGVGAGQQEVPAADRRIKRLEAAIYLFAASGQRHYLDVIDELYLETELMRTGYASPFRGDTQRTLLYYAALPGANPATATAIRRQFVAALEGADALPAAFSKMDPYRAHLGTYTWGSNSVKAMQGSQFYELLLHEPVLGKLLSHGLSERQAQVRAAAAGYLHYLHGVNPLGLVYLSSMERFGAERSVGEFYHMWFHHGTRWDNAASGPGPAPGFLVGGANPSYSWAECCPASCGAGNHRLCGRAPPSPPAGQPPQKSYREFNDSWPLNSWEVTENSNGYQVRYVRLLSKFVQPR